MSAAARLTVSPCPSSRSGTSHPAFMSVLYLYCEAPMLAIRLPPSIEKRLEKLARRTGRTKSFYVRQAILEHLDDLEELYVTEEVLERILGVAEHTIPLRDA